MPTSLLQSIAWENATIAARLDDLAQLLTGAEKYTTEVVLQRFRGELTMLDSRGGGSGTSAGAPDDMGSGSGGGRPSGSGGDLDDEIPF